ncbi:MAG: DUF4442 domain-containing protein [Bacteroidota bacterium]
MDTKFSTGKTFDANAPKLKKMMADLRSHWKIRMYWLSKLPSLFFWRARVEKVSLEECSISIPNRWATRNPFGSTYFAALAGVAEFSTGMLSSFYIVGRGRISMYVTNFEMQYQKRALGRTTFTCKDGTQIAATIDKALDSGEGQSVTALAVGRNESGEVIAEARITWSFKEKG